MLLQVTSGGTGAPSAAGARINLGLGPSSSVTFTNLTLTGDLSVGDDATITGDLSVTGLITATGGQIAFPATQVPSSDPNTLDDYEEGVFTPTIIGSTLAGVGTYSVQEGNYTKIGKVVYYHIRLVWSAHTGTGTMSISGLPFTAAAAAAGGNCISSCLSSNLVYTAGATLALSVVAATNTIIVREYSPAAAIANLAMDTAATLNVSGFYFV